MELAGPTLDFRILPVATGTQLLLAQLKGLLYRRVLIFKRTPSIWTRMLITYLIGLGISILLGVLIARDNLNPDPVTFKDLPDRNAPPNYAIVSPPELPDTWKWLASNVSVHLANYLREDLGKEAIGHVFESTTEYNDWTYEKHQDRSFYLILGVDFSKEMITLSYNDTSRNVLSTLEMQVYRAIWESGDLGRLEFRHASLNRRLTNILDQILPLFIMIGFVGYFSVVARVTTDDVKSARRSYLVGCGLRLSIYWISNFIIDYIIWLVLCFVTFMVFRFGLDQPSYHYCAGFVIWAMMIGGISVVLFTYCLSFICQEAETSSTIVMLISLFSVLALNVIMLLLDGKGEDVVPWVMCWIPLTNMFTSLTSAGRVAATGASVPFNDLWLMERLKPLLVGNVANVGIYILVIILIEFLRNLISAKIAESHFRKHLPSIPPAEITPEATAMGEEAQDMSNDFAIRVLRVSRVFLDEMDKPVVAVNNVSLGVKHGSLFGFLGANGAGKTTLMKMIIGEVPPSSGSVTVDGAVAICPQFNSHLTNEMTVEEHFKFFSLIYGLDPSAAEAARDRFVHELVLEDHIDKEIKNLSGGNARKLAIAISLLSPARVVLLDEPTSSLDPLARHAAQRLINTFRGEKTMMLCTHLLNEAEELCDSISVMLKGSIYVVGSPSYLSAKFGTEWRLDVLFSDPTDGRFGEHLQSQIPSAKLVIHRPANEIYSIPSSAIPMMGLFKLMNQAIANANLGVKFFTASSATLEKVFMELVLQSEAAEDAALAAATEASLAP
jgi:ABC-type multidrug transport system ATPase subunit